MSSIESSALVDALVGAEPMAGARRDEVRVVRAPGRVNLMGDHTDYNEGLVLPAAIGREIRIAYLPTEDGRVGLTRLDTGEQDAFDLDAGRVRAGTWLDYVAGTAWALREAGHAPRGLRGVIASNLPEAAGLSSSAAIELASAWALLGEAAEAVDPLELARICRRAENAYVGVNSGLMDQFVSACGVAGTALCLDCRSLQWRPVVLPRDIVLVICATGSPRRLSGSGYNTRRAECEAVVRELASVHPGIGALRDVTPELLEAFAAHLDPLGARRAQHVVAENARVEATVEALEGGDLDALGALFAASHGSLRYLFEVSSPELDALVEIATSVPGVLAARMTGGGFGGCTVNIVRPDAVELLRDAVMTRYRQRTNLTPMVLPVPTADGAGPVA